MKQIINWQLVVSILTYLVLLSCYNSVNKTGTIQESEAVNGASAYVMLDLAKVNNPEKEWCYSPKSTTVIGVPFMPRPVQVTYDGAIYTRDAELCFFYSDSLKPIMARQKTFYEGWIPMVEYEWEEDGLYYSLELFGAAVNGIGVFNTIQFVKISAANISNETKRVVIASASRFSGGDHRFGTPMEDCLPSTRYNMERGGLWRDGKLIYCYPEGSEKEAIPGVVYSEPFVASDYDIQQNTASGVARSEKQLLPGKSMYLVYKMPNFPINGKDIEQLAFVKQADYQEYRDRTIAFWHNMIEGKGHTFFSIPEKRINDAYKAGLVHLMLSSRQEKGGGKRQGSGLPYDNLFFNDYVDMRRIYDLSGHPKFVDVNVQWLLDSQNKEGMFLDPVLTHGKEIMASHGQALESLANHYVITHDTIYACKVYPSIKKAVDWMYHKHKEDTTSLMPASIPFDAEMIKGHYTSHNLWCLLALSDAIRVAKGLNKHDDVNSWTAFYESYNKAVLKAIDLSAKKHGGYVPTGLYDFITGPAARAGFHEYQTNQDWENNLLVYPTEVLEPSENRVKATLDTIRKKYREGIMTYRNGMHLHQYATVNQAHQYLAINDQKYTLLDLYHILLHNGSTHEGFENMVEPWEDMDPWPIPPPHAWAAAKTALLIRNMLVREYGGQAGLHENKRDLYLFSVISPCWAQKGQMISINNAVTEMGNLSAQMTFIKHGAQINILSQFNIAPRYIKITIPYFVNIESVMSNASFSMQKEGYLVFSPDVSKIKIKWKTKKNVFRNNYQNILMGYREENSLKWRGLAEPKIILGTNGFLLDDEKDYPAKPLSFNLVKTAFIKEYNRRFHDYLQAGKQPMVVLPPPLVPKD